MMKGRVVAQVALTLLVFAVTGVVGPRTATLHAADSGEFILCAREDRAAAVAARHNLTILSPASANIHSVFLVRGPATLPEGSTAQSFIDEVRSDPDVEHFDANVSAIVTEAPGGPRLSESTVVILASLDSPVLRPYFGVDVWSQYVDQAAT